MTRRHTPVAAAIVATGLMLAPVPADAIMSGEESRLAPSSDADYAAGKEAFERKDWPAVIGNLTLVILRRPWHDNAHSMLGFAWRKLGSYDRSFEHYRAALALNPRHRGALEYLGEAYLELGRPKEARVTLLRLAEVCNHVVMAFDNTGWKSGCEELEDLETAFAEHGVALPGGS
jgi:tetratricopeptide (TPR) repeat protein